MTDLGFGLADRRSVMIILFTFVSVSILFGNSIPIDASSATTAFFGLAILTGFFYLTRTVFRIFAAVAFTFLLLPLYLHRFNSDWYGDLQGLQRSLKVVLRALSETVRLGLVYPLFRFQEWGTDNSDRFNLYYDTILPGLGIKLLGVLDRLFLVAIAYASTLPSLPIGRERLGLVGIGLMIVVYIITGRFTLTLKDAFHKAEEQHDELVGASRNPNVSFPSSIYTEPKPRDYGG